VAAAAAMLFLAATGGVARAHPIGVSRGVYALAGDVVSAEVTLARADVDGLEPDALVRGIVISANGARCEGGSDGMGPGDGGAVLLRAHFACSLPHAPSPAHEPDRAGGPVVLEVRIALFDDLPPGHRHAAHLQARGRTVDDVLYRGHDAVALSFEPQADDSAPPTTPTRPQVDRFVRMSWMGIEHILTGYDHLVFLFGLVLVGGSLRALLTVISAFTVAHSITLAVAALGIWTPPARVVEPAIALSIAYVGIENFFVRSPDRRWRITLPFGLLHGFGFASALREVTLPSAEVPWALLAFNLGVEIGQVGVIAALVPLLAWVRSWEAPGKGRVVRALSAAVVALGGVWFVGRVL
jgi:hydrogenase/urease accessory protein HupE